MNSAEATVPQENTFGIVIGGPMKTPNNPHDDGARNRMLSSSEVMLILGYRCRKAFWALVHSQAIPCVRFNARVIRFPEAALTAWISHRQSAA